LQNCVVVAARVRLASPGTGGRSQECVFFLQPSVLLDGAGKQLSCIIILRCSFTGSGCQPFGVKVTQDSSASRRFLSNFEQGFHNFNLMSLQAEPQDPSSDLSFFVCFLSFCMDLATAVAVCCCLLLSVAVCCSFLPSATFSLLLSLLSSLCHIDSQAPIWASIRARQGPQGRERGLGALAGKLAPTFLRPWRRRGRICQHIDGRPERLD
jgi:hypothetical protein